MADENKKTEDPKEENPPKEPPSTPEDGQGKKEGEDLPDKFKGKNASDIAKSYLELEKKLGQNSADVAETRKKLDTIGRVIEGNPDLKKLFFDEIEKISGKKVAGEPKETKVPQKPVRDDTRVATEEIIIDKFEEKYGINRVDGEKKQDLYKRIGTALADMLDPSGKKDVGEIIENIPLDRLPKYLDNAYKLATIGDSVERARSEAYVAAKQNEAATFGSIPSSGGRANTVELTPKEREVARKMGISEEDYKKEKIAIMKGE